MSQIHFRLITPDNSYSVKNLAELPSLRELWLTETGLADKDTNIPLVKELVSTIQDSKCFPNLGQLRLERNQFSQDTKDAIQLAWESAKRPTEYLNVAALVL